jgi:hypothetical protein
MEIHDAVSFSLLRCILNGRQHEQQHHHQEEGTLRWDPLPFSRYPSGKSTYTSIEDLPVLLIELMINGELNRHIPWFTVQIRLVDTRAL